MNQQVFPTKGNLIATKKSLELSDLGYELLDRKRNILIREMMLLIDRAKSLRTEIDETFRNAYSALQNANMTLGVVDDIARGIHIEDGVSITYRSVMGVEIPTVTMIETKPELRYGMMYTNSQLDYATICFHKAKELTVVLAEVENSVYRLANAIKKTQRRANSLKNILIPQFEQVVRFISESLEEKEREEFSRLKVIKNSKLQQKMRKQSNG